MSYNSHNLIAMRVGRHQSHMHYCIKWIPLFRIFEKKIITSNDLTNTSDICRYTDYFEFSCFRAFYPVVCYYGFVRRCYKQGAHSAIEAVTVSLNYDGANFRDAVIINDIPPLHRILGKLRTLFDCSPWQEISFVGQLLIRMGDGGNLMRS